MINKVQQTTRELKQAGNVLEEVKQGGQTATTIAREIPLGFKGIGQFREVAARIKAVSGVDDALVGIRGSAATGISRTRGAVTVPKDLDIYIVSDKLFNQAVAAGARAVRGALRVSATMRIPELAKIEAALSKELGFKTTIRIFSRKGFQAVKTGQEIF